MSDILKAVTGLAALALGKGGNKDEGKGGAPAAAAGRVEAKARLDRQRIDGSEDYEGHLMVSVTGSDEGFTRTPICTVLVLDMSGSMGGEKIALLRDTASKIARNLSDKDEIAIVAFASHVETVLERTSAADKGPILAAIEKLRATTTTNMSGGLMQGLAQVNEGFKGVRRIMLLTDGKANEGVSDRDGLLRMVEGRDSSCTVSTFGFGTDCDQELLADMARAGGGNYYFIGGKDIGNVFARELGGMLSCLAQNLEVRIRPNRGGEVLEVLNDFTVEDRGGEAVINAEDLYAGETKHVLVRLKVARPDGKPKARPFSVAHVAVSWDGVGSKAHERLELNPKVTFVRAKDADAEPALEVAEQVALIQAANAQLEAVKAAERGDWDGAQGALRGAATAFSCLVDRGSDAVRGLVDTMHASAKGFAAGTYSTAYGSTVANAALNATKYRKGGGDGAEFLSSAVGSKGVNDMEAAFAGDGGAAAIQPGVAASPPPPHFIPTIWTDGSAPDPTGGGAHYVPMTPAGGLPGDARYVPAPMMPTNGCSGADDCDCLMCVLHRLRLAEPWTPPPCTSGDDCVCPACTIRRAGKPTPTPAVPKPGRRPRTPKPASAEAGPEGGEGKSKFAKRSKRWK